MDNPNYYLQGIVSRTIGQRDSSSSIKPAITPDILPIAISARKSEIFSDSLLLPSIEIPLDDEGLIREPVKEDSDLRRSKGRRVKRRPNDERDEAPNYGNAPKIRADIQSGVRQSRPQQERIEESADNDRQEEVDMSVDKLSSSQRNTHDMSDVDSRSGSQPNLKVSANVASTKPIEDLDRSLIWMRIVHSLGLLSKRLDQVVSQSAGFSERLNRIETRTVMPSSYSDRLIRRAEQQQQQQQQQKQQLKQTPSPSLSLNDYLKRRAGESK